MFGFGKDKPRSMTITPFGAGETSAFVPLLCDGWTCANVPSFSALIQIIRAKAAEYPGMAIFTTLDDFGQATYTSGHTQEMHQLDWDGDTPTAEWVDLDHPTAQEAAAAFALIHRNILAKAADLSFTDLAGKLDWDHPDSPGFLALNAEPDTVLDSEAHIMRVPVANAFEAIAAFPNGYFVGDLSPMENLALARHLEQVHGYRLMGIGASYIAFLRDGPITPEAARALAADILSLHSGVDAAAQIDPVTRRLEAQDWLVLFYSGR